jgi:large subunit ribosomal protein L14e
MKIAGRDAGKRAVVVESVDPNFVVIDGETRRRKCNIKHLELIDTKLDIKKGESHANIVKAFKKINIEIIEKNSKTKKGERPRRIRKSKTKIKKETKKEVEKKTIKKVVKKKVEKKKVVKKVAKKKVVKKK